MSSPADATGASSHRVGLLLLLLSLGVVLLGLFSRSFSPGYALFSNDGPLAVQASSPYDMPGAFLGIWNPHFWIGTFGGNYSPNITGVMLWILGPYRFVNFHVVLSLATLGVCAWFFFRQLRFPQIACVLGGLAAALNGNFFSNAAWGLSSRSLSLALTFLALAAVESSFRRYSILKIVLAGLAVGMSVSEGGDNGAIFSLFVAAYAFARTLFEPGAIGARIGKAIGRVVLMAVCAGVLAVQTINLFVNVAVKGVVNTQQDTMTPQQRWDFATQWSLPKMETLRVIIPGLYGYRMDTPEGGNYRGTVGQGPGLPRHSGAGEYAGVLVVLVGIWGFVQTFRKTKPVYTDLEKRVIWFWAGAFVIAVLCGWGRHAPLYRLVYELPYFSTIRNPMKFMHPAHMDLMILFAYGLYGLWKRYLQSAPAAARSLWTQFRHSWKTGDKFERRFIAGALAVVAVSFLSLLIYSTSRGGLVAALIREGFDPGLATQMAAFSAREVGWFFLFLALSVAAVLALQSGWFGGKRATWIAAALGLILVVDMARANTPWVNYFNYRQRYASNPVLDILRTEPYAHRVAITPFRYTPELAQMQNFYQVEWLQHHFHFHGIHTLDMAQDPRPGEEKDAFLTAMTGKFQRYWQLTNTRYLLGVPPVVAQLNQTLTPGRTPFRQALAFDLRRTPEGYSTAITNTTGPFALIEYADALPRAKLYSQWEVITNSQPALERIAAPDFNPAEIVIVDEPIDSPPPVGGTNDARVEITDYSSRRIDLKTTSSQPGVLLLNDRYDANWIVEVDGHPQPMLRGNFIMRAVHVPAGEHTVRFRFAATPIPFFITLGAVLIGLVLCAYLFIAERRA